MYISLKWAIELSQESNNDDDDDDSDSEWKSNWEQVRAQRMAKSDTIRDGDTLNKKGEGERENTYGLNRNKLTD